MRSYNDGCNINEQMQVDLIFLHPNTRVSHTHITKYFGKHDTFCLQCGFVTKCTKPFISVKKEARLKLL